MFLGKANETIEEIRNRISNIETCESPCPNDRHDFVRVDEFTGGIKYKCSICGLEAVEYNLTGELQKVFAGSYIEKASFVWKPEDMEPGQIVCFTISFGDCPIRKIKYENGKVEYENRINGSRDGWMSFPKGFFDKKKKRLSKDQVNKLYSALQTVDFSVWNTDPDLFSKFGACGFCLHNTFVCTFANGREFLAYTPGEGFEILKKAVSELCEFPYAPPITKDDIITCPGCGENNWSENNYCSMCGHSLKEDLPMKVMELEQKV